MLIMRLVCAVKKDWNGKEPRYKILNCPEDAELEEILAVLLSTGSGRQGVMEVARGLARLARQNGGFMNLGPLALTSVRGVGRAQAARILAAIELARRENAGTIVPGTRISPRQVARWLHYQLEGREYEFFFLFSFNRHYGLIQYHRLARGSADAVQVYYRDMLRTLLNDRASGAIIAHNHPEGSARPGHTDLESMDRLSTLLQDVGIRLLDQYVVGEDGVYSCRLDCYVPLDEPLSRGETDLFQAWATFAPQPAGADTKIQYANPASAAIL